MRRLEPDLDWRLTWRAAAYEYNAADNCQDVVPLDEGAEITAQFCWGAAYEIEAPAVASNVPRYTVGQQCVEQSFAVGDAGEIRAEAQAVPPPSEIRFVIQNAFTTPIVVQQRLECTTDPWWVRLFLGAQTLAFTESCQLCPCGTVGGCNESCDDACNGPATTEIPPGGEVVHVWDGTVYDHVGTPVCELHESAPRHPLKATLCWGTTVEDVLEPLPGTQVADPVCTDFAVDLDVPGEVRLVAGP